MPHRHLKQQALSLLQSDDWALALDNFFRFPPRQIVNPLFGLLCHGEPRIRWRAVSAMGAVVSRMADNEIESARVIMRRLMWTLNDESGGIGWGSPESFGEIMARNERLAKEFSCLLVSYADPEGNYLEHPTLQQGVLWAWGRLGRIQPVLIQPGACLLKPYLASSDSHLRGLATWAAKPLKALVLQDSLKALASDRGEITIYMDDAFKIVTIGRLAREALTAILP